MLFWDHSWQNIMQAKWMISSNKEQTSLDPDPALQASNACKRNCCQRLSSKLPRPKSCPTTSWPDTPTWPVTLNPQHASWTWIRNHENWGNWLSSSNVFYSFIHLSTIFHPWAPSIDQPRCRRVHAPQQATAKQPRVPRVSAQATRTCRGAMATESPAMAGFNRTQSERWWVWSLKSWGVHHVPMFLWKGLSD